MSKPAPRNKIKVNAHLVAIVIFVILTMSTRWIFFMNDSPTPTGLEKPTQEGVRKPAIHKSPYPERKEFTRAAIAFLPLSDKNFLSELKWFLESWKFMMQDEPKDWRTDVIIIVEKSSSELEALNCTTEMRSSLFDPSMCRIITGYIPLSKRENEPLKNYRFGNSIAALLHAKESGHLTYIDALLRTDLDTFVTPAFANWKPEKLMVGMGKYCFPNQITCHRLKRIAKDMGLAPPEGIEPVDNVGSTWYGPTNVVLQCVQESMDAMRYLDQYEFTSKDKENGVANWPGWHYGVLTMYAGQIAVNHCGHVHGFQKRPDMLDFETTSSADIHDHAHLHTWQDNKVFSKFVFLQGGYKDVDPNTLGTDKIHEYALKLALQSQKNNKK